MAHAESSSQPRSGGSQVDLTCPKIFLQVGLERDDARSKLKAMTLKNIALTLEIHEFKMNEMKMLKPKIEKLTVDLEIQYSKVRVFKESEASLKLQLDDEKVKCRAYKDASSIVKNLTDNKEIKRTLGIGFDYNEAVGKASNITPFKTSAEEKGIPFVLKDSPKPLFKSSIAKPLLDTYIIIKCELSQEDLEKDRSIEKVIEREAFREPEKAKGYFRLPYAGLGSKNEKVKHNKPKKFVYSKTRDNRCHSTENINHINNARIESVVFLFAMNDMPAVPAIDTCHKPYGIISCMLCAKSQNTTPRQHINNRHSRSKTASPSPVRKETYSHKPKPKVYKAVFKDVRSVKVKTDVVPKGSVVVLKRINFSNM